MTLPATVFQNTRYAGQGWASRGILLRRLIDYIDDFASCHQAFSKACAKVLSGLGNFCKNSIIAAGNPCKVLRELADDDKQYDFK